MTKKNYPTTQADGILEFYKQLDPKFALGDGVEIMNPFQDKKTWAFAELFYKKFYHDSHPRIFIFGINPGRFGGGITGIPFTDPIRLENECGIKNDFRKIAELSSIFIYHVVKAYGGADKFYRAFLITALSPLGFTKNGLNLNYYDDKQLLKSSEAFIIECIRQQQSRILSFDSCFCLGEGTNYKIFRQLNEKYQFFKEIIPLPHPRWIMQYRRKKIDEFVSVYLEKLAALKT
jgi:Domain of unknown function (DUF4918)